MAEEKLERDYLVTFDPMAYLRSHYRAPPAKFMLFIYEEIHKAFNNENLRGDRLLDIGTGPSVCSIISAAHRFKEIYLSDFSPICRTFLRKWLDGTEIEMYQPFYEFILNLEGDRSHWSTREKELKGKIKDILTCDIHQSSILQEDIGQFDVITSSLCLDAAVEDIISYREICKKFWALLKPGGHVIIDGCIDQTFYFIEKTKYYTLYIKRDELVDAWESAGFDVLNIKQHQMPPAAGKYDTGTVFVLLARKK